MDQDKLEQDLTDAGFEREISTMPCYGWKNLLIIRKGWRTDATGLGSSLHAYLYTGRVERLDASCRGFLLFLEQIQVLTLKLVKW